MKKWLFLSFVLFAFLGCVKDRADGPPEIIEGMKPIYAEGLDWQEVTSMPAQPITNLGKMYYKDDMLYVIEKNRGIHVFDNSDPASPEAISFIGIWGCNDVAIKGNILYADNIVDLVAMDISNLDSIQVVSRTKDVYPKERQFYPEAYSGRFECVDESKGTVVGWEKAVLVDPKCWR